MEEKKISNENEITVQLAVIGKFASIMPGIQEIKKPEMNIECLIGFGHHKNLVDEELKLELPIEECTLFTVQHSNHKVEKLKDNNFADELIENSIFAISETMIWNKSIEKVGKDSRHIRQIGRIDIKYCVISSNNKLELIWQNESITKNKHFMKMASCLFPNMIIKNGPTANPVPYISRRLLSVMDLINLGFYSEAFISSFSLLDDLVQEVVKAGLEKKGMEEKKQKELLRAIKEDRLNHYLNNILPLCDMKAMDKENEGLYKELKKKNTLRNNIVHNSKIIERKECLESTLIILNSILWLRQNPFGYKIPEFPILQPIEFQLAKLEKD